MFLALLCLMVLLTAVCMLWFVRVYITVHYPGGRSTAVAISLQAGWLHYRLTVRLPQSGDLKQLLRLDTASRNKENKRPTLRFYLLHPRELSCLAHSFRYTVRLYYRLMMRLDGRLRCEELVWHTRYGFSDAALTAVSCGLVWNLKLALLARAGRQLRFRQRPVLTVKPVFGRFLLNTEFKCIFSIRLGNIIYAVSSIIILYRKGGRPIHGTSNSRFAKNCHGKY